MSGGGRFPSDDELSGDELHADDIEASLNDALSDLERMLEQQGPEPREIEKTPGEEQYTIPLLDEVVIPGPGVEPQVAARIVAHDADADAFDDDEPALRRRLAERLASEIEVIVYDRVERAIEQAKDDLREQVRNHLDIILPEIVEEILQQRQRRGS